MSNSKNRKEDRIEWPDTIRLSEDFIKNYKPDRIAWEYIRLEDCKGLFRDLSDWPVPDCGCYDCNTTE